MKAISSMATRKILAEIGEEVLPQALPADEANPFELESVGGVDAAKRVADGEVIDLVFLAEGALKKLAADGHVVADTVTPLMLSQVAVAVSSPEGGPAERVAEPAFANADELRERVEQAERIGYSTGPSGTAFLDLLSKWGIREELEERLVQARPGVPVAKLLADGEVDFGLQQLSELVGEPGIKILGVLPDDCAIDTVFGGAVGANALDESTARSVLAAFASAEAAERIESASFRPLAGC